MKIGKLFFIAIVGLLLCGQATQAQVKKDNVWVPKLSAEFDPATRAEKATKRLTKVLGLDEAQKTKVLALNTKRLSDIKASIVKAQSDHDKKAFHAERKRIITTFEADLKAILNVEQWPKYEALKSKVKEKVREKAVEKKNGDPGLDD